MQFEKSVREGYAKIIKKDPLRAKSLIKVAEDVLITVKEMQVKEQLKDRAKELGFDNLTEFIKWSTKEKIFQLQKVAVCLNGTKN